MNNEEFAQKNTCRLKKVLVTGASGFIGSFLVEGGLERELMRSKLSIMRSLRNLKKNRLKKLRSKRTGADAY